MSRIAPYLRLALVLGAVACGPSATSSKSPPSRTSPTTSLSQGSHDKTIIPEEYLAWLQLYDEAGLPNIAASERVDFFTGSYRSSAQGSEAIRAQGWLIQTTPYRVVLNDALWREDLPGSASRVPAELRVPSRHAERQTPNYSEVAGALPAERTVDFTKSLEAELVAAEKPEAEDDTRERDDRFEYAGRLGPVSVYWVARARFAQLKGRRDLAVRCLKIAARALDKDCQRPPCDPIVGLREGFQRKLLWQAVEGLEHWMPRTEVLVLAKRAAAIAPQGRHAAEALSLARRVEKALAEDAEHARQAPRDPSLLSLDDKVEELVYWLREQNGFQMSQPGACDPFMVGDGIRNPGKELFDLGRKALGRLVLHVGNEIPTRSVGYHRDFYFSHRALTVGEVVLQTIDGITGRAFYASLQGQTEEERARSARELVEAWWSRASGMSEKDDLLDNLRTCAQWNRASLAQKILSLYGMDAFDELVQTYRQTQDASARAALIPMMNQGSLAKANPSPHLRMLERIRNTPGPEQTRILKFLRSALQDTDFRVRRAAAEALLDRADESGLGVVLRDLRTQNRTGPDSFEYRSSLSLLLRAPRPDVIAAIVSEARKGGAETLEALASALRSQCDRESQGKRPCGLSDTARAALIEAVAPALLSQAMRPAGSIGGYRERDAAATAFAQLQGGKYTFNADQGFFERDLVVLRLYNEYRASKRQPPVKAPDYAIPAAGAQVWRTINYSSDPAGQTAGSQFLRTLNSLLESQALLDRFLDLVLANRSLEWTLRIVRFPQEGGTALILHSQKPQAGRGGQLSASMQCWGVPRCQGGFSRSGGTLEDLKKVLLTRLGSAWEPAAKIEEYAIQATSAP